VGDTDGVHYVPVPLGKQYPLGLLVVQNGEAPEPPDTDPQRLRIRWVNAVSLHRLRRRAQNARAVEGR